MSDFDRLHKAQVTAMVLNFIIIVGVLVFLGWVFVRILMHFTII